MPFALELYAVDRFAFRKISIDEDIDSYNCVRVINHLGIASSNCGDPGRTPWNPSNYYFNVIYYFIYVVYLSHGGGEMDICLNLDGSNDSSEVLKYSALYFDKIALDTYLLGNTTIYPSEETFRDAKLLQKEGILEPVVFSPWENYSDFKQNVIEMVLEDLDNLTGMNPEEVMDFLLNWWCKAPGTPEHEEYSRLLLKKPEVLDTIPSVVFGKKQNEITINDMVTYYYILLYMLAWHQAGNEFPNILTNNRFLSSIMRKVVSKNQKEQSRESEIAVSSMRILLPYIRCSSMEEVLEIRNYAKDELLELSSYIDDLYKSIDIEKKTRVINTRNR